MSAVPLSRSTCASRITIGECVVFIWCTALGFAWHAGLGIVEWNTAFCQPPVFWPYLRWMGFLVAPAIITPAPLFLAQTWVFGRQRRLSVSELCWLVVAGLWCFAIGVGVIGWLFRIQLLIFCPLIFLCYLPILQFGAAATAIVAVALKLSIRGWRSSLRWTDALAVLYLVVLSVSGIAVLDAINHI